MITIFDLTVTQSRFSSSLSRRLWVGVLLGLIGVMIRVVSIELATDTSLNTQPVLLGLTGLFTGGVSTLVAVAITGIHRVTIGGPSLLAGLVVIAVSAAVGLLWRTRRGKTLATISPWELATLGLVLLLLTAGAGFLLPDEIRHAVQAGVSAPTLLVFPLSALITGVLLRDRVRREAEIRALREAQLRTTLAAEVGKHGVFDLELATGVTVVNSQYAVMLGHDPTTFEPSLAAWLERVHPEDRERVTAEFQRCVSGLAASGHAEYRIQTAAGGWIWVSSSARGIDAEATGTPTRLIGTHTDISPLKTLQDSQHLQLAALQATADAIVITTRDGVIEWCNPAFTEMTGYAAEDAVGKNPRDLFKSGTHDSAFYATMWKTILAGEIWSGELVNRRADGTTYLEHQTITPVTEIDGTLTHFVAVKRDITSRRQLEAQFHQAQKMETIGRLASTVAHDFNNLLTVIISSLDLARLGVTSSDPIRVELVEAQRAAERGAILTRQLLGFSRVKAVNREPVDLGEVVRDVMPMLTRLISEKIQVTVAMPEQLPLVLADSGQLGQVLLNLVVNARDAMPEGGHLTISARLPAGAGKNGAIAELRVEDTGTGMTQEVIARAFDPFFTTKEAGKGTGLGLSTVQGIVRGAGGEIHVESIVGKGTAFTVTIPLAGTPQPHTHPVHGVPTPPEGQPVDPSAAALILLVEDEEIIRRVARRVLERNGHRVLEAANGDEALDLVASHGAAIAMVITDLVMPGMTGADLIGHLRSRLPTAKLILTSGYTAEAARAQADVDERMSFLGKPFGIAELSQCVRSALSGQP